jgi:hypothetical protein
METEDTLKSRSETLQADFRWVTHHGLRRVVIGHIFVLTFDFLRTNLRIRLVQEWSAYN